MFRDGSRDTGLQFCSSSVDSEVQTKVEMKEVGVQVNLPLLTAECLQGDDQKTRFYTGFVNFGTFMVIFNSFLTLAGGINYWNGKDSLKEKPYLENEVKQKPGPKRKIRLVDEYLYNGLHEAQAWTAGTGLTTKILCFGEHSFSGSYYMVQCTCHPS